MTAMRRFCAWCGKLLGGSLGLPVSHGVCPACRNDLIPVFLDTLAGPILLLGDDARGKSANQQARVAVEKDLPAIEGRLIGEILDCRNAALPGGCGKTPLCPGCSIRSTVEDTFKTGAVHEKVPAVFRKKTGQPVALTVSTRRVKEGVLLLIDRAGPDQ